MNPVELENLEVSLLLEAVFRRYGYDFRNYSPASLKRRILQFLHKSGCKNVAELIPRLLHDRQAFQAFLSNVSVSVTEMFRDPHTYRALREQVVAYLKTYPFVKIWLAGCATGEEIYSLAILLEEEGVLGRAQIYATDIDEESLAKARQGIFDLSPFQDYTRNYQLAGGKKSFADYYHSKYGSAIMRESLRKNIVFSSHNLATDAVFGEMHLVVCRNVLIYFDQTLQDRALTLFRDSLVPSGFLWLGTKESLNFSTMSDAFQRVCPGENLFRLKRPSLALSRNQNGLQRGD